MHTQVVSHQFIRLSKGFSTSLTTEGQVVAWGFSTPSHSALFSSFPLRTRESGAPPRVQDRVPSFPQGSGLQASRSSPSFSMTSFNFQLPWGSARGGQAPAFMHPIGTHVENPCVSRDLSEPSEVTSHPRTLPPSLPSSLDVHSPQTSQAWSLASDTQESMWDTPHLALQSAHLIPHLHLPTLWPHTCKEGHKHGHPAQDVRPGKAPVPEAAAQEADGDSSINGQGQQDKEGWGEGMGVWVGRRWGEVGDAEGVGDGGRGRL